MPVTPSSETIAPAYFKPLAGDDEGVSIPVHFNPASLQYTVSNTQDPNRRSGAGVQFVTQSIAKLTMDLIFDTTLTGEDVRVGTDQRAGTDKMAKLLRPYGPENSRVPPSVEFGWGTYKFTGIVEQYKETLDFFSADGVPLRSSVNITLSSNSVVFDSARNPAASVDGSVTPEPVEVPDSAGPSSAANALGDPRAARAIASLSGSASLRFGGGASLAVSGGSASLAVSGSVSLSPSSAISAGGELSLGSRLGIGADTGLGVTATAGAAFAGLRVGASATTSRGVTNLQALLPSPSGTSRGSAGFGLGGAARASDGGSLSADVGAFADLNARIGFSD